MANTPVNNDRKRSAYAEAADPSKYRKMDDTLFSCKTLHHHYCHKQAIVDSPTGSAAAVLCSTAGKNGRNQTSAAVGATVFWLTCPNLNNLIGRMERNGEVQIVQKSILASPKLKALHVTSHSFYETRVRQVLSETQWQFFEEHFINPTDSQQRKYGNAAVSHDTDMKCLHALVAQTLCGAANPCGSLVSNYVRFLSELLPPRLQKILTALEMSKESTIPGAILCDPTFYHSEEETRLRECLDSKELFSNYLDAFVEEIRDNMAYETVTIHVALPKVLYTEKEEEPHRRFTLLSTDQLARLPQSQDLCSLAHYLIVYLNGKVPKGYKKNRVN